MTDPYRVPPLRPPPPGPNYPACVPLTDRVADNIERAGAVLCVPLLAAFFALARFVRGRPNDYEARR